MSKVCAIIVAYNPDNKILLLLESIKQQFDEIVIVNNGMDGPIGINDILRICPAAQIIDMYSNKGIAAALNRGIERAVELNMQYVATFDQDSRVPANFTAEMLSSYSTLTEVGRNVGIICPLYRDSNSGEISPRITFNRFTFKRRRGYGERVEKVTMAITSGSFMPMSLFSKSGRFIEDMFIDYVDNEFCLRLKGMGFEVYINMSVVMEHSLGERTKYTIGGLNILPTNHSPMRKYYISRNRVYCVRRYGLSTPSFIAFEILAAIKDLARVIVFERQKKEKVRSILIGLYEGLSFKPSWEYR